MQGGLQFGHGIHFCTGAALARMKARAALEALVARYRRVERRGGGGGYKRSEAGLTAFIDGNAPLVEGMKVTFHGHLEDDYGTMVDATAEATLTGVNGGF